MLLSGGANMPHMTSMDKHSAISGDRTLTTNQIAFKAPSLRYPKNKQLGTLREVRSKESQGAIVLFVMRLVRIMRIVPDKGLGFTNIRGRIA